MQIRTIYDKSIIFLDGFTHTLLTSSSVPDCIPQKRDKIVVGHLGLAMTYIKLRAGHVMRCMVFALELDIEDCLNKMGYLQESQYTMK